MLRCAKRAVRNAPTGIVEAYGNIVGAAICRPWDVRYAVSGDDEYPYEKTFDWLQKRLTRLSKKYFSSLKVFYSFYESIKYY